jgi:hypothetical protein
VFWQTPIAPHFYQAPCDTILYSLARGIDEIIMFGGMELTDSPLFHIKPSYEQMKHRVSSKLFVMKPASLHVAHTVTIPATTAKPTYQTSSNSLK